MNDPSCPQHVSAFKCFKEAHKVDFNMSWLLRQLLTDYKFTPFNALERGFLQCITYILKLYSIFCTFYKLQVMSIFSFHKQFVANHH